MKRDLSDKLFQAAKKTIPGGVNSPVRAFKNVDGEPFLFVEQRVVVLRMWTGTV